MDRCALCKGKLRKHKELKDEVEIKGWKCSKCKETYFSSNELLKWEIFSGRRKNNVRKIRKVGNSFTVTLPNTFVRADNINNNDLAIFKRHKDGYILQIVHL
ncbi:MAG: AbrB/MazE/SpoVT family DNA-binding domain-containing protein [Thermoplasmata archaeon]|nr:MAG: AbrB/MazE/SpoVT family DNA-binding domain-containing protein [Thermoplasmata archaeon]